MIRWKEPPKHFGDLIKEIPFDTVKSEYIIDRDINFTQIIFYILNCIWILAKEIHALKSR